MVFDLGTQQCTTILQFFCKNKASKVIPIVTTFCDELEVAKENDFLKKFLEAFREKSRHGIVIYGFRKFRLRKNINQSADM